MVIEWVTPCLRTKNFLEQFSDQLRGFQNHPAQTLVWLRGLAYVNNNPGGLGLSTSHGSQDGYFYY